MRKILFIFVTLISLTAFAAPQAQQVKAIPALQSMQSSSIKGLEKINTKNGVIYVAKQPEPKTFLAIQKLGVKTIVNLRKPIEMLFNEKQEAKDLGFNYVSIPVAKHRYLKGQSVAAFNKLLANKANYPLFIHCQANNRSIMMLAVHWVNANVATPEQAIAWAEQHGIKNKHYVAIMRQYFKQQNRSEK